MTRIHDIACACGIRVATRRAPITVKNTTGRRGPARHGLTSPRPSEAAIGFERGRRVVQTCQSRVTRPRIGVANEIHKGGGARRGLVS